MKCPSCTVELRNSNRCPCGWKKPVKKANEYDHSYYANCRKNRSSREFSKKQIDKIRSNSGKYKAPKKKKPEEIKIDPVIEAELETREILKPLSEDEDFDINDYIV